MRKLLITAALFLPVFALAVQVSVPSAPSSGFFLVSTTTGNYIATTSNPLHAATFFGTSNVASWFPYASSTSFTATTVCLTGDTCRTTWPTSATWGNITGSLSNQSDLVAQLSAKLGTSSALTANQLIYATGFNTTASVGTSTLTASSPLTGSFTQIGSGGSLGIQAASVSQNGYLSSTDWGLLHTATTTFTYPLTYTGSTNAVTFPATSTLYGTCTAGQVIGWSANTGSLVCMATSSSAAAGVTSVTASFPLASSGGATPNITSYFSTTTNTGLTANSFLYTSPGGIILTVASSGLSLPNTALQNSSISGVALGGNLAALTNDATLLGSSYNGSGAISDWGIDLAHSNTWTALQNISAAGTTTISNGLYANLIAAAYFDATSSIPSRFPYATSTAITTDALYVNNFLLVGTTTDGDMSHNIALFRRSSPGTYSAVINQNTSNDPAATTDFITNNDASPSSANPSGYYGDFGQNSHTSVHSSAIYDYPDQTYLYNSDAPVVIGSATTSAASWVGLFAGGTGSNNEILHISTTGASTTALRVSNLKSCDTIDTDATGLMTCGTDATSGGGGWPFSIAQYAGTTVQSTTTPLWLKNTQIIASTTYFTYASTTNLETIRFAADWPGSDIGARVNNAYANCPTTGCTILIGDGTYSFSTQINFNTLDKHVHLQCTPGTRLTYTGSATSTIFNTGWSGSYAADAGMFGCDLRGQNDSTSVGLQVGGSNGAAEMVFRGNHIVDFAYGIRTEQNAYLDRFEDNMLEYNNRAVHIETANNSGENMIFSNNVIADCDTVTKCFYADTNATPGLFLNGNSFDDAQLYLEDGNYATTLVGGYFENPNSTAVGQYAYIVTTGGGYSNMSIVGTTFWNGDSTVGKSPNAFIMNRSNLVVNNVTLSSLSQQVPAFVNNSGGDAHLVINGFKNVANSVASMATSGIAFMNDATAGTNGVTTMDSATTTTFFGAMLKTCSGSSFLQWASGQFACGTPAGGAGADPFTHTSVFGQTTSATSTLLALTGTKFSLVASSTVMFVNATTTQLQVGSLAMLPYGSACSSFNFGSFCFDTTDNQLQIGTSTSATAAVFSPYRYLTFTVSTTSWAGTTTQSQLIAPFNGVLRDIRCKTDAGTLNAQTKINSTNLAMFNASTTANLFVFTANTAIAAGDIIEVDMGTPASSPTINRCTARATENAT